METQMPKVCISVVDADSLNICMCNVDKNNVLVSKFISSNINESMCQKCTLSQNLDKPIMISKQVVLGNVIVNRIDNQYLSSTYSSSPSQMKFLNDPYTPESIESHSPQPEMDDEKEFSNYINSTNDDDEIMSEVIKHKNELQNGDIVDETDFKNNTNHIVSARQLQTRLEILRRESLLDITSNNNINKNSGSGISESFSGKKSHKNCCLCCSSCVIL